MSLLAACTLFLNNYAIDETNTNGKLLGYLETIQIRSLQTQHDTVALIERSSLTLLALVSGINSDLIPLDIEDTHINCIGLTTPTTIKLSAISALTAITFGCTIKRFMIKKQIHDLEFNQDFQVLQLMEDLTALKKNV